MTETRQSTGPEIAASPASNGVENNGDLSHDIAINSNPSAATVAGRAGKVAGIATTLILAGSGAIKAQESSSPEPSVTSEPAPIVDIFNPDTNRDGVVDAVELENFVITFPERVSEFVQRTQEIVEETKMEQVVKPTPEATPEPTPAPTPEPGLKNIAKLINEDHQKRSTSVIADQIIAAFEDDQAATNAFVSARGWTPKEIVNKCLKSKGSTKTANCAQVAWSLIHTYVTLRDEKYYNLVDKWLDAILTDKSMASNKYQKLILDGYNDFKNFYPDLYK